MKKITIIGLGWLGLPLAQKLQNEGWQVAGSKRTAGDLPVECYPLDLNHFAITPDIERILATDAMVITLPPSTTSEEGYFSGIQKLASFAMAKGLKHLIFISSTSVLPMSEGNFAEDTEVDPNSLLAKVENWLLSQKLDCDILRLAGLVGKQRHPVFYLAGKSNLKAPNQPVNLVHLEDCVFAISLLLAKPNGQRIFHLCAEQHPTRKAYYGEMAKRFGLADLQFSDENQLLVRVVKADKICRELGFIYRYPNPYDFKLDI
ncbi:GDP-L-fucose synthase [Mannheimia sp. USDA-ARS-USMARC-1261]|uniref:GDP-L-fucose synthase n=1 Tax=Mannheimia sp. USDA-ARS-USMARC-1261 TaxID=1432056 RepID=UPI0003E3D8BD|nr:GDP-L-fucose synthase [Mannheimia sp. USDA-ARS-USMARC-1261]AHG72621.1 GDP-L-fucose synthase [Mannheimia sp. USDA-ARS-USMARC-1261]